MPSIRPNHKRYPVDIDNSSFLNSSFLDHIPYPARCLPAQPPLQPPEPPGPLQAPHSHIPAQPGPAPAHVDRPQSLRNHPEVLMPLGRPEGAPQPPQGPTSIHARDQEGECTEDEEKDSQGHTEVARKGVDGG